MEDKKTMLKLINEDLKEIENMTTFTLNDKVEQRNAIHTLRTLKIQVENEKRYSKAKGKELLHKLLEGLVHK